MRTYVIPARATTKSNLFELLRTRCMDWQYSFQADIMRYYLKGVRQTYDEMGGLEFFESTSTEQRRKMWSAIFDQNKVMVATASLGQIHRRESNYEHLCLCVRTVLDFHPYASLAFLGSLSMSCFSQVSVSGI